jgi:hypothetical protein
LRSACEPITTMVFFDMNQAVLNAAAQEMI